MNSVFINVLCSVEMTTAGIYNIDTYDKIKDYAQSWRWDRNKSCC